MSSVGRGVTEVSNWRDCAKQQDDRASRMSVRRRMGRWSYLSVENITSSGMISVQTRRLMDGTSPYRDRGALVKKKKGRISAEIRPLIDDYLRR